MELEVYWTQIAEDKLNDIFSYYKLKAGHQVAQKLINGIIDTTIDLEKTPKIGQKENILSDRTQNFRYLIHKNYKVIYWINEKQNRIEIATIFDSRQNPEKMTKTK